MNDQEQEGFSYDEMREALQALPKHRSPFMDGLTPTFFLEYLDLFKVDLCIAFHQILCDGCMLSYFTKGLIYLIPKSEGPLLDIKKWRPNIILIMLKQLAYTFELYYLQLYT